MTRLLAAALFLTLAAAPAIACSWNQVSTETRQSTVAAQPQGDQTTPPPTTPASQKPS